MAMQFGGIYWAQENESDLKLVLKKALSFNIRFTTSDVSLSDYQLNVYQHEYIYRVLNETQANVYNSNNHSFDGILSSELLFRITVVEWRVLEIIQKNIFPPHVLSLLKVQENY